MTRRLVLINLCWGDTQLFCSPCQSNIIKAKLQNLGTSSLNKANVHQTVVRTLSWPLTKCHLLNLICHKNQQPIEKFIVPGLRSRWMIPCECMHSIARAISSANPIATCISKHLGRMFNRYLRNVPPKRSSVTITITGSLQAPINW